MAIIANKGSIIRCANLYSRTDISVMADTVVTYDATNEVYKLSDLESETVYAEIPEAEFGSITGNTRIEL